MKPLITLIIFTLFLNVSHAQFQEVPTPSGNALYSGSAAEGIYPSWWQEIWVCGANGTVFRGYVGYIDLTWINASGNLSNGLNLSTIEAIDSLTAFAGGNIGSTSYIYKTTNGGVNWVQEFTEPSGRVNSIWMRNATTGFAEGNPVAGRWSLWRTTNGGSSWDSTGRYLQTVAGETGFGNSLWCIGDTIIFGTSNSKIYFSSNYGINWLAQSTAPDTNIYSVYWDFANPYTSQLLFAGSSNGLLETTNYGMNWSQQQNVAGTGNILGICSFTGGVSNLIDGMHIYSRSNKIYQGSFGQYWGVFYTAPSGNYTFLFQKRNEPPPYDQTGAPIAGIRDNGGVSICFGCRAGGIREISNQIPASFSVWQNYPNPFNPSTKIKFSIAGPLGLPLSGGEAEGVRLIVYDALGKQISVLVNEKLNPGTYEVEWDASNYSSGVYFYKLETGTFIQTKKMILMK